MNRKATMALLAALQAATYFLPGIARAADDAADVAAAVKAAREDTRLALWDTASRTGKVRVIVRLAVPAEPEGALATAEAVGQQRDAIAQTREGLTAELAGSTWSKVHEFSTIPFVALEVAQDGLAALERSPLVASIEEDKLADPTLAESVPLIEGNQAWAAGFDGTGSTVAILDTGVDSSHPFLAGRVVYEACFSDGGNCPNGQKQQEGPGAGRPCQFDFDGCRHGTHVAGIAAGRGNQFSGVARGASIMAMQIFSYSTGNCPGGASVCPRTTQSDQIAALERVFQLRNTYRISSVNMSLGGGFYASQAVCDANNSSVKAAIDNLRSVGIATVISAGNEGYTNGMGQPGCISSAISVGATTKSDTIASFSNRASFVSLVAPGESINSSVPGGSFAYFNGTSMAAPHVTGAWAVLKQKAPAASVDDVLSAFRSTGKPIYDPANGLTFQRIRVATALNGLQSTTPGGCGCRSDVDNYCFYDNAVECGWGYCDPNGDGNHGDANWSRGFDEYQRTCHGGGGTQPPATCDCRGDVDNFCAYDNAVACGWGYCDPNNDGNHNDANWQRGYDAYQAQCVQHTQACYPGPAGTQGVGICHAGVQTCGPTGCGACVGAVTPQGEICGNGVDENCDGHDEACQPADCGLSLSNNFDVDIYLQYSYDDGATWSQNYTVPAHRFLRWPDLAFSYVTIRYDKNFAPGLQLQIYRLTTEQNYTFAPGGTPGDIGLYPDGLCR
ncbi:MAG: S8 family serine peptidase [Steroidobacteraceae bacterium]